VAAPLYGWPLYSDAGVTYTPALTGGSWEPLLPLTNLQDRRLAKVARSTDAAITSTKFDTDLGVTRALRLLALVNHNFSSAAKVRHRLFSTVPIFDVYDFSTGWTDVNTPTRVAAGFTCSDGVTLDLIGDDNAAAGEQKYYPVVFTGNGTKALRFRVARSSAYSNHTVELSDTTAPALRLALRIDYSSVTPAFSITGGVGTIASTAARGDGSYDVQVTAPGVIAANSHRLYVTPAATANADQAALYIGDFMAWDAATDQLVYDTGRASAWPSGVDAEGYEGYTRSALTVASAAQSARYARTEIIDTANTDGYVQAGRLVLAKGTQSYSAKPGSGFGWTDPSVRKETRGGATVITELDGRRVMTIGLDKTSEADAMDVVMEMQAKLGTKKQLYVVWDPDDTTRLHQRSFLALMKELSPLQSPAPGYFDASFSFVEEIA
jgi:hypothetical protein